MELFLHIGTEKTGTTSVQQFMRGNRALLAENGVLYPRAPGETNHTGLSILGQTSTRGSGRGLWRKFGIENAEDQDQHRQTIHRDLTAEIEDGAFHKAIMSNEHCSSRLLSEPEVRALRDFLAEFFSPIHIVVYLRRQDDFLVSTYSTGVKTGLGTPLKIPGKRRVKARYDYKELLDRWSSVFGKENIICRKFEQQSLISGDLITDFLTATGCDLGLEWERPGNVNSSLDAKSLEFLRLLNGQINPDERPAGLIAMLESASDGPLLDIPDDDRIVFMETVRESNAQVAQEYFGGVLTDSDDPLFARRSDKRQRICEATLTIEDAVAMATRMISLKHMKRRLRGRPVALHGEEIAGANGSTESEVAVRSH